MILDLLVPARALRWGRLTTEPVYWHYEMLYWSWGYTQRTIGEAFAPVMDHLAVVLADMAEALGDDE